MSKEEKKGKDTTVIVAIIGLVGTLIAGLLSSPVILKLLDNATATPAAEQTTGESPATSAPAQSNPQPLGDLKLVFEEDFEGQSASGFAFESGDWKVVKDKSNYVLQGVGTGPEAPAAIAYFGANDFASGIIEFKINFLDEGGVYLDFRLEDGGSYVFNMTPEYQNVILATNALENGKWQFKSIAADSARPFTFGQDTWFNIKLEIRNEDFVLNIDGKRILAASDARFTRGQLRFALDPNSTVEIDDLKVWAYGQ